MASFVKGMFGRDATPTPILMELNQYSQTTIGCDSNGTNRITAAAPKFSVNQTNLDPAAIRSGDVTADRHPTLRNDRIFDKAGNVQTYNGSVAYNNLENISGDEYRKILEVASIYEYKEDTPITKPDGSIRIVKEGTQIASFDATLKREYVRDGSDRGYHTTRNLLIDFDTLMPPSINADADTLSKSIAVTAAAFDAASMAKAAEVDPLRDLADKIAARQRADAALTTSLNAPDVPPTAQPAVAKAPAKGKTAAQSEPDMPM